MFELQAGILVPAANCPHCSRPMTGRGAARCLCGAATDPRGPRHGMAEAFLGAVPGRLHA